MVVSLLVMASVVGGIVIMDTASAQSVSGHSEGNSSEISVASHDTDQDDMSLRQITFVNKVDNDGDGLYSDFDVRVEADTWCPNDCLDPFFGDGTPEPFFSVNVDSDVNDPFSLAPQITWTEVLHPQSDTTRVVNVNPSDIWSEPEFSNHRGATEVIVELKEADGPQPGEDPDGVGGFVDSITQTIELERPSEDTGGNTPPTASFTVSSSSPSTLDTVSFDASGSSDSDGSIQSYSWDFGDGTTATGQTATHSYSSSGTYTVELTVTDDSGATDTTTQTVSVTGGNTPPTASFTVSPSSPDSGETVTFDASGSNDPDGTIQRYEWDFGDGNTASATGTTVTHSYSSSGTYTAELTVEDDSGGTNTTTRTISVGSTGSVGATVKSGSVSVGGTGETGESAITVDAGNGVSIARLNITVDTSVAEIVDVQPGADVDPSQPAQTFDVIGQTNDSVRIEYNNIQATSNSVSDFELAVVEFEAQADDGEATIGLNTDVLRDGNTNSYGTVNENEGKVLIGALFAEPLPGFSSPPQNTGELDPNLYEDLNGDGDGTNPSETVNLWTELVLNQQGFNSLSQEQVDALDWNDDGQLTPADAVTLWTEQVLTN